MSVARKIAAADGWLVDRVFQPGGDILAGILPYGPFSAAQHIFELAGALWGAFSLYLLSGAAQAPENPVPFCLLGLSVAAGHLACSHGCIVLGKRRRRASLSRSSGMNPVRKVWPIRAFVIAVNPLSFFLALGGDPVVFVWVLPVTYGLMVPALYFLACDLRPVGKARKKVIWPWTAAPSLGGSTCVWPPQCLILGIREV